MATLNKNDIDYLPRKNALNPSEEKIPKPKDIIKDKTREIPDYIFTNENVTTIVD